MGLGADEALLRQWLDALGFNKDDVVDVLDSAFDHEK